MGFNDHMYDRGIKLPSEAGDLESRYFDPNDDWIKNAKEDEQIEAMSRWFHARYEDPANAMPYDGREGGFQWVWGGPYDPNEVIQERFGDVVSFEVMKSLIQDLLAEGGDEWAPVDRDDFDYDEEFLSQIDDRDLPMRNLKERIEQIDSVLIDVNPGTLNLILQMSHGSLIAALEAFLADTMAYWLKAERKVLRDFVTRNRDFKKRSLNLSELFGRLDQLETEVEIYLQDQMWHRLDKIKPMMTASLGIQIPDIGELMKAVLIRHDIVHRAGRTKEGQPIQLTDGAVRELRDAVLAFSATLSSEIDKKFPRPSETADLDLS